MTAADTSHDSAQGTGAGAPPRGAQPLRAHLLLFSSDSSTREAVRLAVGRRPSRDVEISSWTECATADAVRLAMAEGGIDLLILDGEASPYGGLGLCRDLKHSIYECPPVIVLTGRPQDAWLGSWSYADDVVTQPVDPMAVAAAVARLVRRSVSPAAPSADATH